MSLFETLTKEEQNLYTKLLTAAALNETVVHGKGIAQDMAERVLTALRLSEPHLFHIKSASFFSGPMRQKIVLEYRFSQAERLQMLRPMETLGSSFMDISAGMSELEKTKLIHDWLLRHITYQDSSKPWAHEAPGPLLYGIGVCDGIAKAFLYLAQWCGLEAMVVPGVASDEGGSESHAWNLVRVDGNWYHLDCTFDLGVSKNINRYDYFLLSDTEIEKDHSWSVQLLPCENPFEYYRREGQFASSAAKLDLLLEKQFENGDIAVFQLPELLSHQDAVLDTVVDIISQNIPFGSAFTLSANNARSIYEARRKDG